MPVRDTAMDATLRRVRMCRMIARQKPAPGRCERGGGLSTTFAPPTFRQGSWIRITRRDRSMATRRSGWAPRNAASDSTTGK